MIYEHRYGTSFGWYPEPENATDAQKAKRIFNGVITDGHSFRDYGLYPREKPVISAPELQKMTVEVPGRDGVIDMTDSFYGRVHYYNRKGTFRFTQPGGRQTWDATKYRLYNELHGVRTDIVIDEDYDGYYTGRLTLEDPEYDDKRGIAYFTITADLEPYKHAFQTVDQPWLWDPFSFFYGYIPDETYQAFILDSHGGTLAREITIRNNGIQPIVPDIILTKDAQSSIVFAPTLSYTVDGVSYTDNLSVGHNITNTPSLIIPERSSVLVTFGGTAVGTGSISFREGWL